MNFSFHQQKGYSIRVMGVASAALKDRRGGPCIITEHRSGDDAWIITNPQIIGATALHQVRCVATAHTSNVCSMYK